MLSVFITVSLRDERGRNCEKRWQLLYSSENPQLFLLVLVRNAMVGRRCVWYNAMNVPRGCKVTCFQQQQIIQLKRFQCFSRKKRSMRFRAESSTGGPQSRYEPSKVFRQIDPSNWEKKIKSKHEKIAGENTNKQTNKQPRDVCVNVKRRYETKNNHFKLTYRQNK